MKKEKTRNETEKLGKSKSNYMKTTENYVINKGCFDICFDGFVFIEKRNKNSVLSSTVG